jgi:HNH endonuclease
MDDHTFNAWSLLSLTRTGRHGVTSYPDELGIKYVYDTTVPNGRYVAAGDLAVLRDGLMVLGAGWIDSIEVSAGQKYRPKCPECNSADVKLRQKLRPRYRCNNCYEECDELVMEELDVRVYTASYSRTWRPADHPFPISDLHGSYLAEANQHAIRRFDAEVIRPLIEAHLTTGESWWNTARSQVPDIPGGHEIAISKTRLGQQRFREEMLARFDQVCAFTGRQPPGALEAAHLYLYSETPRHDIKGGILLRCDLHALFDRWLITIDPERWTIDVAPELTSYPPLAELQGNPVQISKHLRPRAEYINNHARLAREMWICR